MNGNGVIATVAIVGGTTALRVAYETTTDRPRAFLKIGVGAFALGAILTVLSGAAPGVATVLAVMLVLATLMLNAAAIVTGSQRLFGI